MLRKYGRVSTPWDLRDHPYFLEYTVGEEKVPALAIRFGDVIPDNPLGRFNDDLIIFMHSAQLSRETDVTYLLEPKFIQQANGGESPVHLEEHPPAHQILWEKRDAMGRASVWLYELPEVFRWPVLEDLERLGYRPSTVQRQVAQAVPRLPPYSGSSLADLLEQSRRYLSQFASRRDGLYISYYGLMRTPVDDHRGVWYHAPIFDRFDPDNNAVQLKMYTSYQGARVPVLERVMYSLSKAGAGGAHLVPQAIVRPTRVIPHVQFTTVYAIPASLQEAAKVEIPYLPRASRSGSNFHRDRPVFVMLREQRPIGHPFALLDPNVAQISSGSRAPLVQPGSKGAWHQPQPAAGPGFSSTSATREQLIAQDQAGPSTISGQRHSQVISSQGLHEIPTNLNVLTDGQVHHFPPTPGFWFDSPKDRAPNFEHGDPADGIHHQAMDQDREFSQFHGMESPSATQLMPPPRPKRRPSMPTKPQQQDMHFSYRPGEQNPYEAPRGDPMEVLISHLQPHLEDAWRYERF